jgi:hypothetical protein
MANTYVDFTATAAQTDFPFSFPYLEGSHVVVEIDGVTKTLTTDYTISTGPSKVVLTSGATAGQKVRVKRDSNADSANPLVDFVNGSVLTESSLDRSYLHNLYLNEEIGELNQLSLQKEVAGTEWDAKTLRIKNVPTATDTTDAVNKTYVDTQISNQITGSSTASAKYAFTGDGSTAFTFSPGITLGDDTMYEVAIDGVLQEPTVAYAIDANANTITFTSAPPTSSKIVVVQRGYSVPAATAPIDASVFNVQSNGDSNLITSSDTLNSVGIGMAASAYKLSIDGDVLIQDTTDNTPVLVLSGSGAAILQLKDTSTTGSDNSSYNVGSTGGSFSIGSIKDDGSARVVLFALHPKGATTAGAVMRLAPITFDELTASETGFTAVNGMMAFVTDGAAGQPCVAVHDGATWKRVDLGATISKT